MRSSIVAPGPTAWKPAVSQPRASMNSVHRMTHGVVDPYDVRAHSGFDPAGTSGTLAMATIPAAAFATAFRVTTFTPCSAVGLTM